MSSRWLSHWIKILGLLGLLPCLSIADMPAEIANSACNLRDLNMPALALQPPATIATQLGWVEDNKSKCGGYYLESAFLEPGVSVTDQAIRVNCDQGIFPVHGTTICSGEVSISRGDQQSKANHVYLCRDPASNEITVIYLKDNVKLRAPNVLILAEQGRFDIKTKQDTLKNILYRTTIYSNLMAVNQQSFQKITVTDVASLTKPREVTALSAWGGATNIIKPLPRYYELTRASYSTCPPTHPVWEVKATHITLNRNTGRGVARNAKLYVKKLPVFYTPYLNFPIDSRRQTGFLWPIFGTTSGATSPSGVHFAAPFYWNMAPNYDMKITPHYYSERGGQIDDAFRYLTPTTFGQIDGTILPGDRAFQNYKGIETKAVLGDQQNGTLAQGELADLHRLLNSSDNRSAFTWQNNATWNEHWSSNVNYNYVSDDYYLRDFSGTFDEVTQNQLLRQGEVDYKSEHWGLSAILQSYQTLHPVDQNLVQNQYGRTPEISFNGDYPDQLFGLDYFINGDITHFTWTDTPGFDTTTTGMPVGNRFNLQPGIALPLRWSYAYLTPRIQWALTQYDIGHIGNYDYYRQDAERSLPILDVKSGLYFDRNFDLFHTAYLQTLEPQLYYLYVPYRYQDNLPVFDTTLNPLTYDQLFNFNRFTGIDRIGDTNQISLGLTTRFIDQDVGFERFRIGIGQIVYFHNREVTLCTLPNCPNATQESDNQQHLSVAAGVLNYNINPAWGFTATTSWNPQSSRLDTQTAGIGYHPDSVHLINLGYTFLRNGDAVPTTPNTSPGVIISNDPQNNLSQTDLSFSWPVYGDIAVVGRWTQNWNREHFQNLLYGLEYDSCCYDVRFVASRTFTNLTTNTTPNRTYHYNTAIYLQVALKGLGAIGTGDPTQLLASSITGYQSRFGQPI